VERRVYLIAFAGHLLFLLTVTKVALTLVPVYMPKRHIRTQTSCLTIYY